MSAHYDHLRAWCAMMGSDSSFTRDEIALAREQGAPDDVVYRNPGHGWVRFEEVESAETRRIITERVEGYRAARAGR